MRDAPSELAKALQALRLVQLSLEPLVFGLGLEAHPFGLGLLTLGLDPIGLGLETHPFGHFLLTLGGDAVGLGLEAPPFGHLLLTLGGDAVGLGLEAPPFGLPIHTDELCLPLDPRGGVSNYRGNEKTGISRDRRH